MQAKCCRPVVGGICALAQFGGPFEGFLDPVGYQLGTFLSPEKLLSCGGYFCRPENSTCQRRAFKRPEIQLTFGRHLCLAKECCLWGRGGILLLESLPDVGEVGI